MGLILTWPINQLFIGPIPFEINTSLPLLAVAGLLVGLGTRIGNGCTGGHGVCGVVFGLGLIVSGMANPAKVIGFLDITGTRDPTLAFVMAGALAVTAIGYPLVTKAPHPVYDKQFYIPTNNSIDNRLLGGAALFGLGWGLIGLCPGPALVALGSAGLEPVVFALALALGLWLGALKT